MRKQSLLLVVFFLVVGLSHAIGIVSAKPNFHSSPLVFLRLVDTTDDGYYSIIITVIAEDQIEKVILMGKEYKVNSELWEKVTICGLLGRLEIEVQLSDDNIQMFSVDLESLKLFKETTDCYTQHLEKKSVLDVEIAPSLIGQTKLIYLSIYSAEQVEALFVDEQKVEVNSKKWNAILLLNKTRIVNITVRDSSGVETTKKLDISSGPSTMWLTKDCQYGKAGDQITLVSETVDQYNIAGIGWILKDYATSKPLSLSQEAPSLRAHFEDTPIDLEMKKQIVISVQDDKEVRNLVFDNRIIPIGTDTWFKSISIERTGCITIEAFDNENNKNEVGIHIEFEPLKMVFSTTYRQYLQGENVLIVGKAGNYLQTIEGFFVPASVLARISSEEEGNVIVREPIIKVIPLSYVRLNQKKEVLISVSHNEEIERVIVEGVEYTVNASDWTRTITLNGTGIFVIEAIDKSGGRSSRSFEIRLEPTKMWVLREFENFRVGQEVRIIAESFTDLLIEDGPWVPKEYLSMVQVGQKEAVSAPVIQLPVTKYVKIGDKKEVSIFVKDDLQIDRVIVEDETYNVKSRQWTKSVTLDRTGDFVVTAYDSEGNTSKGWFSIILEPTTVIFIKDADGFSIGEKVLIVAQDGMELITQDNKRIPGDSVICDTEDTSPPIIECPSSLIIGIDGGEGIISISDNLLISEVLVNGETYTILSTVTELKVQVKETGFIVVEAYDIAGNSSSKEIAIKMEKTRLFLVGNTPNLTRGAEIEVVGMTKDCYQLPDSSCIVKENLADNYIRMFSCGNFSIIKGLFSPGKYREVRISDDNKNYFFDLSKNLDIALSMTSPFEQVSISAYEEHHEDPRFLKMDKGYTSTPIVNIEKSPTLISKSAMIDISVDDSVSENVVYILIELDASDETTTSVLVPRLYESGNFKLNLGKLPSKNCLLRLVTVFKNGEYTVKEIPIIFPLDEKTKIIVVAGISGIFVVLLVCLHRRKILFLLIVLVLAAYAYFSSDLLNSKPIINHYQEFGKVELVEIGGVMSSVESELFSYQTQLYSYLKSLTTEHSLLRKSLDKIAGFDSLDEIARNEKAILLLNIIDKAQVIGNLSNECICSLERVYISFEKGKVHQIDINSIENTMREIRDYLYNSTYYNPYK